MTCERHEITRADIMDMAEYAKVRDARRKAVTEMKKNRRVHVGPDPTAYFENYDTMWHQIHEMLRIEQGGEAQIEDELRAYNPLIPKGRELVATLMFEIDDPVRRDRLLSVLGGVEHAVTLAIGTEIVSAVPEDDVERTTAEGKASSIQFLHFPLTDLQAEAFKGSDVDVVLAIDHAAYGHMAKLPPAVRQALAGDLD
ncbi:MAG: DUF3501 family protein [Alphaproteobacteria bacterium]|nr:DUF3501 family protein [Alphaproteobacteria bacterium]